MKLKAVILTSLILGTSSLALAKPADLSYGVKADVKADLSLRDHRGPWRPTWTPLSDTISASRRNTIKIGQRVDNLNAIRLQSKTGATYIYALTLRYADGSNETIEVDKWLYAGAPVLTFDLPQHRGALSRVVVSTWTSARATYQVMGQQMRRIVRPPVAEQPPAAPPPVTPAPVGFVIAKDLTFANTPGYVHIPVGVDKGRFEKMRIESTGSSTFIDRVHVTFANGNQQLMEVNKVLHRGETIDLAFQGKAAHAIVAITVMAERDVRAIGPSASKFNVVLL
jgi:hypothetical protein